MKAKICGMCGDKKIIHPYNKICDACKHKTFIWRVKKGFIDPKIK